MLPVTFPGEHPMGDARLSLPLRQVLGQMKLNLLRVDGSGVIVEVHDGFCQMTGYVESELLGREAVSLLWERTDEALMQQKGKERRLGVVSTYEISIQGKDGRRIWVCVGGYPVVDSEGRFEGSIGLHLDITNQKEQEQRMSYLNANLELELQKNVGEILELYRRM
jgi:PAS domain S-box-containing protein